MPLNTIILVSLLIVPAYFIISKFPNANSTQKMLLGIEITIIGGILAIDPNSSLNGIEYIFVLLGLIITSLGFIKIK